MKNIFITGANGYIGAHLSKKFAENGFNISGLCYRKEPSDKVFTDYFDRLFIGDIRSDKLIEEISQNKFDTVIHLVSLDHHQSENEPKYVSDINILPTWNLLEFLSKSGNLEKFIYFSTFQVYGDIPKKKISEEFPTAPKNNYGLTHLLSEKICSFYNRKTDINCINVRLTNSYGSPVFSNNNCWWLVINDLCKMAHAGNNLMLKSDGAPQRDFIHRRDVFNAIDLLIKTNEKDIKNNTYHVSSGETLSILEIAHQVQRVFNSHYNSNIQVILPNGKVSANPNYFNNNSKYTVMNSKLRSLDWMPNVELATGIVEIFHYLDKYRVSR